MASSSGAQSAFQQQFKCKECGLVLNSAESLEVHRQYHEGNLMQQWAAKAHSTNTEEKNNNMTKQQTVIKREFSTNNSLQCDNSDTQKKSPEYNRSTPEAIIYGHPPTPQSYQSASSPYQNNDSSFSPNFHNYPGIKSEGNSPSRQQPHYQFQNFTESQQFYNMDPSMPYGQEMHSNNAPNNSIYRYQPYSRPQYFESSKSQLVAPLASPAYPPQPTPSPSPKQCDKCGYVCESAAQLIEHNNISHPNNGPQQYDQNNQFLFNQTPIKEEDTSQNEILDLDSHKVVHPDWSNDKDGEKRPNEEPSIPHSVNAMLNTWPSEPQQPILFQGEQNSMFMNAGGEQKMFGAHQNMQEKFISPQLDNHSFMNNTVSSSNSELGTQQSYRPFEHMSAGPNSVISSTQVPQSTNATPSAAPPTTKSASWKSNEARRPKTYNCTACNKWFTSSGHLKRHYNTTLHKNAVKSSGQPDPATMPISAHHHPTRESGTSKDDSQNSNSPREDSRGEDSNGMGSQYDNRLGSLPGIAQHPNNPYERPVMHHAPAIHSPIGQHHTPPLANPNPLGAHMIQNSGYPNCSNGSPPNGDAGLSQPDSRGLLSMAPTTHTFNMMSQHHLMPMETTQFQMYPNGSAPHVTQATDTTSNHNITGEIIQYVVSTENQPLPSFAQIQINRFGGFANVGGLEPVTVPVTYNFENEFIDLSEVTSNMQIKEEENGGYKLSVTNADQGLMDQQNMNQLSQFSPSNIKPNMSQSSQFSPNNISNNNNDITFGDMTQSADMTYPAVCMSTPSTSLYISPPSASQLSTSTDPEEESKENFEDGVPPSSPNVSSSVPNQDLSKTKCFDCDKEFMRPCYLTQHNKQCHNGEKPFKCEMCGKKYSDATICAIHTKKHGGPKPHKCDRCPKMFNHKTDLRRHICCHTGKKPYACEICGKGFIRKDHMVKHMVTHTRKKEKYKEKPKIKHRAMRR